MPKIIKSRSKIASRDTTVEAKRKTVRVTGRPASKSVKPMPSATLNKSTKRAQVVRPVKKETRTKEKSVLPLKVKKVQVVAIGRKSTPKKSIKQHKILNIWYSMVLSLILVLGGTLVLYRFLNKSPEKGQNLSKSIFGASKQSKPYYDRSVFIKPSGITPMMSTNSATVTVRLPVIMYHYIEYVKDQKDKLRIGLNVTPANFEHQLKTLQDAGFTTYFVKEMSDMLDSKTTPSTKGVVLTFDDGYEDFYTDAFPLLKKYNMKATMYIIYDYIGRPGFMNEAQIAEIMQSGLVELGAHTMDHVYLKTESRDTQKYQLSESKKKLEERFHLPVETVAYPFGAFNNDSMQLAREAGFTVAVSVIPGVYHTNESRYYITRIRPGVFMGYDMIKVLEGYTK